MNNSKRVVAAIVAVAVAAAAIILTMIYVSKADERAMAGLDPVDVVVVTQPIPAGGIPVPGTNVEVAQLPAAAIPAGAVTDPTVLSGQVARVDLVVGEALVESRIGDPNSVQVDEVPVPNTLAQVQLPLTAERALGGLLNAGDTVGVVISYSDPERTTTTVLHGVLVSKLTSDAQTEEAVATQYAVTLAGTAADLQKVVWGAEHGTVWLTLETAETDLTGAAPVTIGVINPAHQG